MKIYMSILALVEYSKNRYYLISASSYDSRGYSHGRGGFAYYNGWLLASLLVLPVTNITILSRRL